MPVEIVIRLEEVSNQQLARRDLPERMVGAGLRVDTDDTSTKGERRRAELIVQQIRHALFTETTEKPVAKGEGRPPWRG